LVAPLRAGDQVIGVVSVKRHGSAPPYESADPDSLSATGADVAAPLSFVDAIARAEEDRKQAIALYELSRLGSLGGEPQQELDTAVAMLADVMHHDVVGLWVLTPEGLVERRAFRGYGPTTQGVLPEAEMAGPFGDAPRRQRPVRAAPAGAGP